MKIGLTIASLVSLVIGLYSGWHELHGVLIIGFLAFVALLFTRCYRVGPTQPLEQ